MKEYLVLSLILHNPISVMASVEPPVKKKRGRPPGPYGPYSKNKKKIVETSRQSNRSRGRGRGVRGRGRARAVAVSWMDDSVSVSDSSYQDR